ncbi:MAG: alpha/beta hydrolase [Nannocystaceae bacterium]
MKDAERIELHAGGLRFGAYAQGEGPVVLCLHGFPDHARSYREQLPALAEAGYRAIAPTMRGYEPSSQPRDGRYYLVDLAEDVIAWIDELGERQVSIVGHDWGALTAQVVALRAPERVRCMVTMAVPHLRRMGAGWREVAGRQLRNSWYVAFFQLRGLADWVVERDDFAFIEWLWRRWSPGWELPQDEWDQLEATFAQPGVRRAALGYYRCNFGSLRAASRGIGATAGRSSVPTLLMTGERDGCVDTRLHDFGDWRGDFVGEAKVVRVAGAGHFLHQERGEAVNREIVAWLGEHAG